MRICSIVKALLRWIALIAHGAAASVSMLTHDPPPRNRQGCASLAARRAPQTGDRAAPPRRVALDGLAVSVEPAERHHRGRVVQPHGLAIQLDPAWPTSFSVPRPFSSIMPRLVMPNALWVSFSMPAMACRFRATNYLVPTDAKLAREGATRFSAAAAEISASTRIKPANSLTARAHDRASGQRDALRTPI